MVSAAAQVGGDASDADDGEDPKGAMARLGLRIRLGATASLTAHAPTHCLDASAPQLECTTWQFTLEHHGSSFLCFTDGEAPDDRTQDALAPMTLCAHANVTSESVGNDRGTHQVDETISMPESFALRVGTPHISF